jgi:DNA/RNA endonuclease G (NUC1)
VLTVTSASNITLSSGKTSLAFAMQTQFFVGGTDASGNAVASATWSTSNPDVITVDSRGIVTGKGLGSAQLTATAADGSSGSVGISVYMAPGATIPLRLGHNEEFGEPTDADASDDFIIHRPQYTVSYNPKRGGANWVSWNLDKTHIGDSGRCAGTCYSADTVLTNAGLPAYTTADWVSNVPGQTGYDRGHMAPSADWTSSEADNNTTFFLTNFLPQRADLNQGPWEVMEIALRDSVKAGREAYIIAGGIFTKGVGSGTLLNLGKIGIPDSTYKIVVFTPEGTGINADGSLPTGSNVIAVNMPNVTGIRNVPWETYKTTVAKIEKSTGYDFLALLAESTECRVEVRNCAPVAHITGTGVNGGIEGASLEFLASTSTDADNDPLTYLWDIDGVVVGSGATLSRVFPDNGTYAIRLIATDGSGAADTTTSSITVANVAPSIGVLAAGTVDEGSTYSGSGSFTDPGDDHWTATVDYGDGSGAQPLALAGKTFSLSHTYAASGSYRVTVTVKETDVEAATGSQIATVTVANVAPVVATFAGATILRGESYAATGSFADPGADTWTATVNYGDGSGTSAVALDGKGFTLQHSYGTAGVYTVTVAVADADGGSGARTAQVTVLSTGAGITSLASTIASFASSGAVQDGDAKWLVNKLDVAAKELAKGNAGPTRNQLQELIDRIDAARGAGRLSADTASSLTAYATRLLASMA